MKDRTTLGFSADVLESAALTVPDVRAEERIYEACDCERRERLRATEIDNAMRRLAPGQRAFARRVLKGHRWHEIGISRQAFSCKLKKICDLLERPVNKGRKRCSGLGGGAVSG